MRSTSDQPLDEDGSGNKEYNKRHCDYDSYNDAYSKLDIVGWNILLVGLISSFSQLEILSVYKYVCTLRHSHT